MECPNCKHCIINSDPIKENDSSAISPVVAGMEEKEFKGPRVPCVVCCDPVPAPDPTNKYKIFDPVTPEEKECDTLFQWFLLNFRFELSGKNQKGAHREVKSWMERFDQIVNKHSSLGWDGEGGKSLPLPFCQDCKCEVNGLLEKKNSLKTLTKGNPLNIRRIDVQRDLKEEMSEVTRKMKRCEVEFLKSGIYDKDKRYHRVRNGICKTHWSRTVKALTKKTVKREDAGVEEVPQRRPAEAVEVPCIICFETLTIFLDEGKMTKKKAEDMRSFKWFLSHLQNPKGQLLFSWNLKSGKGGKGRNEMWDGMEGKSEPLQFCGGCREGILGWIDIRLSAIIRRERARAIRGIKERMRECEDKFIESGIYKRDRRYFNVRRKVIKVLESDIPEKPKYVPPPPPTKMKKKIKSKIEKKVEGKAKLFEKREMDRILGEGFGGMGGTCGQQVEFVVKGEEDEEDWQWGEEDDEEEDEEPPMDFEDGNDLGEDPLGFGGAVEDHHIIRVKQEDNFGGEEDSLGPDTGTLDDFDDKQDDDHHRNCLLCYKHISKKESALAPSLTNDLNELNFNVVFVLRKMLNVPELRLVGYLEKFGCPGKWVEFCKSCLGMVDQALRIQKEIAELEKKLRKCQERMVEKIKSTSKKNTTKNRFQKSEEINRITEETRQFVNSPSGKKPIKNVTRAAYDAVPVPEVANDDDNCGPLESPPSVEYPDDQDFDPGCLESDSGSEPEDPNPISAKKIKLSEKVIPPPKRSVETGKKFLENFKQADHFCSLCPNLKRPMSLDKFYRHLIFHTQRPFKCTICNVYWSSPAELEKNPFVKENPPSTSDHVCSEATLVKVPNGKLNLGEIWTCKWCPIKFDNETGRDLHEDQVHGYLKTQLEMSEYKCLSCSKGYRSYQEWLFHRVLEHPKISGISCLFCDYSEAIKTKEGIDVLDWLEMKRHVDLEHPACKKLCVSPYICDFCGLPGRYKTMDIVRHIKSDHKLTSGLSLYSCPCCHYRTDRLRSLKMHLHLRHSLDPPSLVKEERDNFKVCDVCGKEGLRSEVKLMDHRMANHGIEPEEMEEYTGQEILRCGRGDECGFRTLIKRSLRVHMRNRHGNKRKRAQRNKEKESDEEEEDGEDLGSTSAKKMSGDKGDILGDGYFCEECPSLLQPMSLGTFYRHLIFHVKRPFKCNICNVYWGSPKELEKNPFVKDNPLNSEHVCSEATLVKVPEGKFNAGKIWSCNWCHNKKFDKEKDRDLHEEEEHASVKNGLEMKYKCLSCSMAYRSHEEWLLHRILEHPRIAVISCLFCDFTSVIPTKEGIDVFNWAEMRKHVYSEHSGWSNKNLFFGYHDYCDFCGVTFRYGTYNLGQHIKEDHKLTSGEVTHSCSLCYYRCDKLRNLRLHFTRSHSHDPRPPCKRPGYPGRVTKVICDICGNSLLGRVPLCDHKMNRHGMKLEEMEEYKGEKVLECEKGDECGGFRTLMGYNMREHMMKKHGAERRWKCDQCGKGFTGRDKLSRHMEIHRNKELRPHQCEICGNSFAVKNYLYIHKRLSHQNRPFASTNRKRTTKSGPTRAATSGPSTGFPPVAEPTRRCVLVCLREIVLESVVCCVIAKITDACRD